MKKITVYIPWKNWVILIFEDWDSKTIKKDVIAWLFEKYGGSFVQALWFALYKADVINTLKILTTFDDYVKEYIKQFLEIKD